jgi:glycosyltransferase involved in cell wall biosynthesis
MSNQPETYTVSIIVPVHNTAAYLRACLNSLSAQTLYAIEVIIVNDGSTDNSQNIIDEYVRQFPHIFRSFLQPHSGLSDARNFGIQHARGSYIGFVDSDDYVASDMFAQLYHEAIKKDADVCFCGYTKVFFAASNDNLVTETIEIAGDYTDVFDVSVKKNPRILIQAKPYAWNKIQRKHLFDGLLYPTGRTYEDCAVTYNLLARAKGISYVAKPLYFYRQRPGSIIQTANEHIFDMLDACKDFIIYYRSCGLFEDCEAELQTLALMHIFNRFKFLKSDYDRALVARFINQSFLLLDENFPNWRKFYCQNFPHHEIVKWIRTNRIRMILYYMVKPNLTALRMRINHRKKAMRIARP